MKDVFLQYQTLISGMIGIISGYLISILQNYTNSKKQRYERRLYIYRCLLSNAVQVASREFVAAFNMILIEFKDDKEILEARSKFLDTVSPISINDIAILSKRKQDFEDALIRLITLIGRRVNINIEQMDIKYIVKKT